MIVYLHGFRSSPQSFKARLLAERLHAQGRGGEYLCPQLPPSPAAAVALAEALIAGQPPEELTLIGSSLGGYYATWLAERTGCRAVLLNPAVAPSQDLASQVGSTTAWHNGEPFEFRPEYIDELQALAVPRISRPERYFLVAATGDEVLDWRDMTAHYALAKQLIVEGSDHGLSDFVRQIDAVLAFCDGAPGTPA
nr:YqiA/YcfP family alpha/beta fold hydrolase [uncultured Noviherbaspirillum sp.]